MFQPNQNLKLKNSMDFIVKLFGAKKNRKISNAIIPSHYDMKIIESDLGIKHAN